MAYYNTCPNCGANLDPGEPCDCEKEKEKEKEKKFFNRHLKTEPRTGQFAFVFNSREDREGRNEQRMCI